MQSNHYINQYTAYCGVDCAACEDFKRKSCPGCKATQWKDDDICMPVRCCREKGIAFCGDCAQFPCRDMEEFYRVRFAQGGFRKDAQTQ